MKDRRHALFICSRLGAATSNLSVDTGTANVVHTQPGPMDSETGAFGGLQFGIPARLKAEARMVRQWGGHICNDELFPCPPSTPSTFSTLALRPVESGRTLSTVNGVIYVAYDDNELFAATKFYTSSGRHALARFPVSLFETPSWQTLPSGTQWVHAVVSKDHEWKPPHFQIPILQTYVEECCKSFLVYGEDFVEEFLKTSQGWCSYWLDDVDDENLGTNLDDAATTENADLRAMLERFVPAFDPLNSIIRFYLKQSEPPGVVQTNDAVCFSGPIAQQKTEYFCFGMGSLINTPSRVGTAGPEAMCAIPVAISADYQFCPCWNFQNRAGGSQLTAGGMVMRRDPRNKNPEAETVGVIYPCPGDAEKMAAMDEREVGYTRFNIPLQYIKSLGWQSIPEGITVFQYVPDTELPDDHPKRPKDEDGNPLPRAPFPTREYPLPQTYVDVCITGCLEYGRDFAAKWIKGFVGWPTTHAPFWLNDRPVARRPWLHQPSWEEVDAVLRSEIPESISCRLLPAEFAAHFTPMQVAGSPVNLIRSQSKDLSATPLDVTYISYKAGSRKPVRAAQLNPNRFIFEYDDRINLTEWRKVCNSRDIHAIGIACRLSKEAGFKRSFCLRAKHCGGFTAPSLVKDEDGAREVNGVLYPAPQAWLDAGSGDVPDEKDDPFVGDSYTRAELSVSQLTPLSSLVILPQDAKIFTYFVANPEQPSFEYPILQRFLDTIFEGCMEYGLGEDFCAEWIDSTDGWISLDGKCYWMNDRLIARRPWMHLGGSYKIYDRLVYESSSPCIPEGLLLKRRLPEEYVLLR
eukprot:TRINITY_DN74932_c0_g1_i1.p1 TRINITY_DN74932_c0_g1~~TRINITY_DN74932_c0_g1_i1.p1  ORF type:complete len:803 (-),score=112.19 TRINITY_DN74932_c0_g1_i1:120-2528(-)